MPVSARRAGSESRSCSWARASCSSSAARAVRSPPEEVRLRSRGGARPSPSFRLRRLPGGRDPDDAIDDDLAVRDPEEADCRGIDVTLPVEAEGPENPVLHVCLEELVDDRRPAAVGAADRVEEHLGRLRSLWCAVPAPSVVRGLSEAAQERLACRWELLGRNAAESDQHSLCCGAELGGRREEEAVASDQEDIAPELPAQILDEAPAVEARETGEVDQLRLAGGHLPGQRCKRRLTDPLEVSRPEPLRPPFGDQRPA